MPPLRITHLSHNDQKGGGPLACYRLHRSLLDLGTHSRMLVLESHRSDPTVVEVDSGFSRIPIHLADRLPLRLYGKRMPDRIWSPGCFGIGGLQEHPQIRDSDVIGLYWVNGGFLSVSGIDRLLQLGKPVVWRLSDLWPFTGGCHHPGSCDRFKEMCGQCPQLGSDSEHDLSARQLREKRCWRTDRLTIVAPSRWIADLAAESALFRNAQIRHIATGVDLSIFKPCSKDEARQQLGLPANRRLILFGANNAVGNPRKGFSHLIDALDILIERDRVPDVDLVVFGSDSSSKLPLDLPLHAMGVINEDAKMALLYSAADLFVSPSLEENLPNTIIEAMASGTPAVAFAIGGTGELIEPGATGYLATAGDSEDLAEGLTAVLDEAMFEARMGRRSRDAMAANHDQRIVARRYLDLYDEIHADQA